MKVKKQHIRVFLEGIEFTSVNSLVMTEAENGPVNFTITTSYVKRIQNLLPKTLCHVFYLHNGEYRFILEGELTNIGFEKSSLQKLCSLQFTGTTLNWRNHYILAKDTSLRFFDRGAFLVLNGEMPFTWDDSEKSVLDRSNPKFSLETSSNSNGYVTNPDIYNPIQSFNQGTWNALLLKLKTPIDVEKILEHTIPKMPKDVFFALLAQESAKDLYFSKNTSSAVDKSIFVNFYKATLRPSNKTGTNLPLYSYQDKVGSNTYKKSPTEYGHTAWGLLQVMGFNLIASPDFTQVEIDTLINGIEYKELVKSQTTLPNSKTPSLGSEYTLFEDQRSGKYFRIPSTEYLVALQCKAAYEQLKRVIFSLSKTAVIDQSLPNQVNVKKIFEYWMGANTNAGRLYANEVYEYFKLAIKEYQTGSLNTNFVGPTEDSYKERYSNAPENPQYETYKNNSERYSFAKEYKPWIKSIVDGGLMITDAKKYIAEALVNNSLEDLVASILDALAITSTYYKTLHQSLPLDVSRVFITDNAPARKLFSYGGMSEFLASRALQGTGGTVISGTDLLKILINTLGYSMFELGAPVSNLANVIITPDTTFMTPLLCNTFFPDQVQSLQFVRNMETEPTRYAGFTNQMGLLATPSSASQVDLSAAYVTPRIPDLDPNAYISNGINKVRQYTFEECYRGVHAQQGNLSDTPFEELLFDVFNKKSLQEIDKVEDTMTSFISEYWKSMIDGIFLKQRYSRRTATITSTYSPERLCGFPACVVDSELPTVVGKISSIVTTISADGQAISNITLSHVHTHWDDDLDTVQFKNTYNYSNDAIPPMDHIYRYLTTDEDKNYRWFNLGSKIYAPMLGETEDKSVLAFAESKYLIDENIPTQDWANYNKALGNAFKNIRARYNTYENKTDFTENVITRNLLTMDDYFMMVLGYKKPQDVNYRNAMDLLDVQERLLSNEANLNLNFKYKPFIYERRARVEDIVQYLQESK